MDPVQVEEQLRSNLRRFQVGGGAWRPSDLSDVAIEIYILSLEAERLTKDLVARFGRDDVALARRQLNTWQLVLDYETSAGRSIAALPPSPAWTARAADFSWTIQVTPELLQELDDSGHPVVDAARHLCREIAHLASELYSESSDRALHHRTRLKSSEHVTIALSQLFDDATGEVLAMSAGPRLPHLALLWEAIERRLTGGSFSYVRIVSLDELVEHGLSIVRRDVIRAGVDLWVAAAEIVNTTFYLFDRNVLLRHGWSGEITTHKREVNGFVQKHEAARRKARPALEAVNVLQKRAHELVVDAASVGDDERIVLLRRIANGKFAHRQTWPEERFRAAESRLELAGLLVHSAELVGPLPNYALDFAALDHRSEPSEPLCESCWAVQTMCLCGDTA